MTEADIFGVQNPETDELGFVSVMGMLGERVTAGSELLFQLLQPLAESLRFKLEHSQVLPNLHPVKEYLLQTVYE